jgi:4-amino-4-deoxy-L-arabinose transferase-like glycosyltransferase
VKLVLAGLRVAVILTALFSAGEWLRVVAVRIRDPYPIEWMEGAIVAHALRWVEGLEIYVPPSANFIPALYPPLGYWVQGAAMKLLGPGLPAARAASAAATLGVLVFLGLIVHQRTRSLVAAVAVAGAFLDAYVACGSWYDLARNDMIFLFFGVASVFVVTGPAHLWRTVASAVLAALAVWTRQQGLAIAAVGFLHLGRDRRRQALVFLAVVIAATAPGFALLDRATGGWFLRTTWTTLGDFPMRLHRAPLVLERLLESLWIPLLCAVIWLAGQARHHLAPLTSVWTLLMGAFLFNAVLAMIKEGGDVNHLIPVVLFALVLGGFALGELDRQQQRQPPPRPWLLSLMLLLFVVQYLVWPHPSRALVPDHVRAAQRQVIAEIAAIPGDVSRSTTSTTCGLPESP